MTNILNSHNDKMELYKMGMNDREIAEELSTSETIVQAKSISIWRDTNKLPKAKESVALVVSPKRMNLYNKGYNDHQISRTLNIPRRCIGEWRDKNNLPRNYESKLGQPDNRMYLYNQCWNDGEIAIRVGVSRSAVCQWRKRLGLPVQANKIA